MNVAPRVPSMTESGYKSDVCTGSKKPGRKAVLSCIIWDVCMHMCRCRYMRAGACVYVHAHAHM